MNRIRTIVSSALVALALSPVAAQASPLPHVVFSDNFDSDTPGAYPANWAPIYGPSFSTVVSDPSAPSPGNAFKASPDPDPDHGLGENYRSFAAIDPTTTGLRFEFDINVVASTNSNAGQIYLSRSGAQTFNPTMDIVFVDPVAGTWVPYNRYDTYTDIAGPDVTLNMGQYYHFTLDVKPYTDPNDVDYTWTIDGVSSTSYTYHGATSPNPLTLNAVIFDPTAENPPNRFGTVDVRVDNVAVSTPEPASLGLLGVGGLLLLRRRKA